MDVNFIYRYHSCSKLMALFFFPFFFVPCNFKNALNLCCHNLCRVGQVRDKKLENYVREKLICSLTIIVL